MKVITRYVVKEILVYTTACVAILVGILLTVRMLRFADLVMNKGVELGQIALVFLAIVPTFLEVAIPLSLLLGIMLAFARLAGDSELVVLRASGVSLFSLVGPVIGVGLGGTLLTYLISMELRPWGYRTLSHTLYEIARSTSTAGLEPGIFNRLGNLTLYAEKINHQSGELQRVLIDDQRRDEQRQIIIARRGRIVPLPEQQSIGLALNSGVIHERRLDKYITTDFTDNSITMRSHEIFDPTARDRKVREEELTIRRLRESAQQLREESQELGEDLPAEAAAAARRGLLLEAAQMELEISRRFAMPWAVLVLALMGMPLGVQPPRAQKSWGAALSVALAFLVFILYYALLTLGVTLAEQGLIGGPAALWLPNVAVGLLGIFTLQRIGSERWQSIAAAFESWLLPWQFRRQGVYK